MENDSKTTLSPPLPLHKSGKFFLNFASLMVIPAITDVTMSAVCPGKDECSLAIYLSGFQQAIIGLGTVVMMPLIGNLSDQYGRKALLTLPMTLSIIPLVLARKRKVLLIEPRTLAVVAMSGQWIIRMHGVHFHGVTFLEFCGHRTTTFFYAYYLLRTLTAMICEGSINCLALAYVADNVLERQRTSAFGILSGIATAAFVCGTLAARFLSTASTFQVAALVSMLAAVYMRIFLRERLAPVLKKIPSIQDITGLLKSSVTFSQAAVVAFFNSIAEGGMQASIMYYLKARFHFSKNQYADLMLLLGIAGMASQLVFMPLLAQLVAEEKLLAIGLLGGIADALLFSVAWSNWVPYATTIFAVFVVFVPPCLRSIASKQVGPTEQGKAQGCISGIISFAKIVSPLIYSPLTALFLSEDAPFHFPGFSILCIGFATMIAFFQSVLMRGAPPISSHKISNSLLA
ncbi:hypothetical protein OIU77_020830 [Salix suchowensis]|uniref:Major facilitator superfamily (MFS) profile domain-containing protein n=1 Tax=Salix suchowensis TaxID=1278906 RepID=A0ABQ9CAW3_9ROSI|nr:hypothetical protein OIU77_020830 [Salix suchowensis]